MQSRSPACNSGQNTGDARVVAAGLLLVNSMKQLSAITKIEVGSSKDLASIELVTFSSLAFREFCFGVESSFEDVTTSSEADSTPKKNSFIEAYQTGTIQALFRPMVHLLPTPYKVCHRLMVSSPAFIMTITMTITIKLQMQQQ